MIVCRILKIYAIFFLSVSFCHAELYKCNGTWSNKPCDENAKPVEGLPKIGKVSTLKNRTDISPSDASLPTTLSESSPSSLRTRCQPTATGLDLRVVNYSIRKDVHLSYLEGRIKNNSDENLIQPAVLRVKESSSGDEIEEEVLSFLGANSESTFSIPLSEFSSGSLGPTFVFELIYSPAKVCKVHRANIQGQLLVTKSGRRTAVSKVSQEKMAQKALNELRNEIQQFKRRFRVASKHNQSAFQQYNALQLRYSKLCNSSLAAAARSGFKTQCRRFHDFLQSAQPGR